VQEKKRERNTTQTLFSQFVAEKNTKNEVCKLEYINICPLNTVISLSWTRSIPNHSALRAPLSHFFLVLPFILLLRWTTFFLTAMGDEKKPKAPVSGVWSTVKPFVNGGTAGMLATCVIQPIDMIKVTSSFHLSALLHLISPNGLLGLSDSCCLIQICGLFCVRSLFMCYEFWLIWWVWWCRWGFNWGKDPLRRSLPTCSRMRELLPSIRFLILFPCSCCWWVVFPFYQIMGISSIGGMISALGLDGDSNVGCLCCWY